MKTFRDFLYDIHDVIDLEERSLSRIKSKSDKTGIATLSASRSNLSKKETIWLYLKCIFLNKDNCSGQ